MVRDALVGILRSGKAVRYFYIGRGWLTSCRVLVASVWRLGISGMCEVGRGRGINGDVFVYGLLWLGSGLERVGSIDSGIVCFVMLIEVDGADRLVLCVQIKNHDVCQGRELHVSDQVYLWL